MKKFIRKIISNIIFLSLKVTTTFPLTTIYASLKSHKSDLSTDVLNLIYINFLPYLSPNVFANDKKPYPLTDFLYFGSVEYLIFIMPTQ